LLSIDFTIKNTLIWKGWKNCKYYLDHQCFDTGIAELSPIFDRLTSQIMQNWHVIAISTMHKNGN